MQFFFGRIIFTSITIYNLKNLSKPYPFPCGWKFKWLFIISHKWQGFRFSYFFFVYELLFLHANFSQEFSNGT